MRFGIMAMQIGALIPPAETLKDPMAFIMGFDHAGLIRQIHSQGFNLIELGGDLTLFFPQSYTPAAIEKLAALKNELGISFTMHLPLWSVEPSTLLQPVRQGSVRALVEAVQATLPLEIEQYVLHATGALAAEFYQMRLPENGKALILRQFQANAKQSIKSLLAETGLPIRKLAVETIEFPFELMLGVAEEMDTSICLDTGHVLAGFSGPIQLFAALEAILPRLGEIHLHDAPWQGPERKIGYGKDHQTLGTGDLDTARLINRLTEAQWNGPIIFELTVEQAQKSLQVIQNLGINPKNLS
ncbi:MAG TPA: cobamide remodeling phosphodiesterase CbiR [Anaerolineaceae bacterium]